MNSRPFLPYGRQSIGEVDIAAVVEALESDTLTTGPLVEKYEAAFAEATGAGQAVACNSGTAALHLAVMGARLGPGSAVIVPSITFVASANAVRMTGADVVFCDVDPDTGLMRADDLEAALHEARKRGLTVKAAIPVHLNGQVCDMDDLGSVASRYDLDLIEDACHALGVENIGACSHSRFACFSTHPVKAVATGEGGVLTTRQVEDATRVRQLRNHGLLREAKDFVDPALSLGKSGPHPWSYEMHEIGWNYRIPDVLCALGLSQLTRLGEFQAHRRRLVDYYNSAFQPLAPAVRPVSHGNRPHGWHLYPLLISFDAIGMDRDDMMSRLRERGIGTQVHYIPVHRQPYYAALGTYDLPGADEYYARCLSIPFYSSLAMEDAQRVATEIRSIVQTGRCL